MNIALDIAATLSAVLWPIVVLTVLFAYRSKIPALIEGLASRISKIEFAGVSLELARAKPFVPEWAGSPTALDLRHKATALQVTDSTERTFLTQLIDEGTGDYAEINLGTGGEWLTSRLFIMAIVFAQMKGIGCFVFVETSGSVRKRFVGWAEPARIRWALAKRYPWLERAYAEAYAAINSQGNVVIVSRHGRFGYPYAPGDPGASIDLLKEFLQRIQQPFPPPPIPAEQNEWVVVDPATNTHERARWINAEELERVLEDDCSTAVVHSSELRSKNAAGQLKAFLAVPARLVAVVSDDQRFEYLVRRDVLVEQLAKSMASEPDGPL
jgi:hypothetical protein